ncbi:MAG TPA: hypothetical protein DCX06_05665 [Opitutae bacterium]|nr:hypothetical protein [Opitutae bacterium]
MALLIKELTLICVLTLLGASFSIFSGLTQPPWSAPELEAGEIHQVDAEVINPIWVDARPEVDYETAHIEGALSLNDSNWDSQIFDLMGAWLESPQPIVVYCSSASCDTSKQIAERLRMDLPDAEIYSLHGGWQP